MTREEIKEKLSPGTRIVMIDPRGIWDVVEITESGIRFIHAAMVDGRERPEIFLPWEELENILIK